MADHRPPALRALTEAARAAYHVAEIQPESLSDAGIQALDRFYRAATPDALLALYASLDAQAARIAALEAAARAVVVAQRELGPSDGSCTSYEHALDQAIDALARALEGTA